jgi:hypothetical protein
MASTLQFTLPTLPNDILHIKLPTLTYNRVIRKIPQTRDGVLGAILSLLYIGAYFEILGGTLEIF